MKSPVIFACLAFGLVACGTPEPERTLPEGAPTTAFTFRDEAFLRGMTGNTINSRSAAILDVTYKLTCLSDRGRSRFDAAKKILDERYFVAPLFFNNPRCYGSHEPPVNRDYPVFGGFAWKPQENKGFDCD